MTEQREVRKKADAKREARKEMGNLLTLNRLNLASGEFSSFGIVTRIGVGSR